MSRQYFTVGKEEGNWSITETTKVRVIEIIHEEKLNWVNETCYSAVEDDKLAYRPGHPSNIEYEMFLELETLLEDLKDNFEDIRDRQITFYKFKEKLSELWSVSKGDLRRAILRLENAVRTLKSEDLTLDQINALEEAVKLLKEKGGEGKKEVLKILLNAGIFTVPVIEDLSSEYAEQ